MAVSARKQSAIAASPERKSIEPTKSPSDAIDVPDMAVPPLKFSIVKNQVVLVPHPFEYPHARKNARPPATIFRATRLLLRVTERVMILKKRKKYDPTRMSVSTFAYMNSGTRLTRMSQSYASLSL